MTVCSVGSASLGKKVSDHGSYAQAQCPGHDDRDPSLTIYHKPGRIKIVCFAGCNDELDILPALGLTLPDLWDDQAAGMGLTGPIPTSRPAWRPAGR